MTHDRPGQVTAGAVTRTIAHETGVVAISMLCEPGTGATTNVRQVRADGPNLEVLGVLHALLAASKAVAWAPGSTVVVRAPQADIDAVRDYLDNGRVSVPEALHQLSAIGRRHKAIVDAGIAVRFEPGTVDLSAMDTAVLHAELTAAVEQAERAHARKHAATWELPSADAAWAAKHDATVVYTDGSQMAHTGFGSWAWCTADGASASGTIAAVTSTHVERLAIFKALRAHRGPVLVVTDMDGILPPGRGRTQDGGHARLLRRLRAELERENVRVLRVDGHDRCPGNIEADRLAGHALAHAWSRVSNDPTLAGQLVALSHERQARRKLLRAESCERGNRRWDQQEARRTKQLAALRAELDQARTDKNRSALPKTAPATA